MPNNLTLDTLTQMLTYRRPHGSRSESKFIHRFIDVVPGIQVDAFGNRMLRIGQSTTMFSCHTDTVHTVGGRQSIHISDGHLSLNETKWPPMKLTKRHRDCLGADNAAGVFVLLNLISAKVPGLYVFHRAEEVGGHGSKFIAKHTPGLLANIKRCIAFDRRGQTDIITHQMMGRCCSDDFAWALTDSIGMKHEPCPYGTFTDSANYVDLIPECTNVSVGYETEHTSKERLYVPYLEALITRLLTVDFDALPTVRTVGTFEDYRYEDSWLDPECVSTDSAGNRYTIDGKIIRDNGVYSDATCMLCECDLFRSESPYGGLCRECFEYISR